MAIRVNTPPTAAAQSLFWPAASYAYYGSTSVEIATGDLNEDGNLDLAVDNNWNEGGIRFGNGDGAFGNAAYWGGAGTSMSALAAADFNNDAHLDLLVGNSYTAGMGVALGNGDGTFDAPITFETNHIITSFSLADFDGNGRLDLALVLGSMGDIYLFSGDGAGGFDSAALLHTDEWWNFTILAAGDFNGDGHIDLAARGRNGSGVLYVFLGDGQWNFSKSTQSIQYSERCAELVVGDVNEDGNQDLLQAGREGLSVLLSHGDGTFGDATPLASGANTPFVPSVALADIDGDAHLDVVAALSEDNRIGVLLGDGTGQFGPAQPYAPGVSNPEWLAVADFNHDGRMDLAALSTTDHRVGVLLGTVPSYTVAQGGLVRLNASATFDPDQDPTGLVYKWDLDGDGVFGETGAVASRGDEIGMLPNFSAAGLQTSTLWTVALQVTDNLGLNSSDTATIYVGPPAAPPPAGALDPTFGIGGMQSVLGSQLNWMAVTVQVDGQIVIAGMNGSSVAVWRENPDGSPDRTFGTDGMALWAPAGLQSVVVGNSGVAVQNDGKIVVAGSIQFARFDGLGFLSAPLQFRRDAGRWRHERHDPRGPFRHRGRRRHHRFRPGLRPVQWTRDCAGRQDRSRRANDATGRERQCLCPGAVPARRHSRCAIWDRRLGRHPVG